MTVLVLAACPVGLRGHLTRWLLEISPGVFVGKINARVRDLMWDRVIDMAGTGRAIMVYTAQNEQGLAFRVHEHHWTPVEVDGIHLMLRPASPGTTPTLAARAGATQANADASESGDTPPNQY